MTIESKFVDSKGLICPECKNKRFTLTLKDFRDLSKPHLVFFCFNCDAEFYVFYRVDKVRVLEFQE